MTEVMATSLGLIQHAHARRARGGFNVLRTGRRAWGNFVQKMALQARFRQFFKQKAQKMSACELSSLEDSSKIAPETVQVTLWKVQTEDCPASEVSAGLLKYFKHRTPENHAPECTQNQP